ncbi:MAG: right-handed parallel beta-helix repeat-containing protein [Deltaproteobacteria bacterium]|nr:right-handed parallel beta-helix repeat-containing protein [Deltaproteobacteria bacterium]
MTRTGWAHVVVLLVGVGIGAVQACDSSPGSGSGSCDGIPPEVDDTVEGVSWLCVGPGGGSVLVPGRAGEASELIIPPEALAASTKVVIRRPKEADWNRLDLRIEPADAVLSRPVTLRVRPHYVRGDTATVLALHAGPSNPIRESDAEDSNWRHADVVARDSSSGSFDVELNGFGGVFLAFDPADRAVLVPEVPRGMLRPGDILPWLTQVEGEPGPGWLPGHVGLFACHGERGDMVFDVTPGRGICMRSLDDLLGDATLTSLGVRRFGEPYHEPYDDDLRRLVVDAAVAASLRPSSYAMAGSVSTEAPSSASFVEDALDAAGRGLLPSVPGFWGSIPHGTFADTVPIDELPVPRETELQLPVSLRRMHGGLTPTGQYLGDLAVGGTIAAEGLPEGATFEALEDGRYVLSWRPTWAHVGERHTVTLAAGGEVAPGVPYDASLELGLFVPGIRGAFHVSPGNRRRLYECIPEGVEMGEYRLLHEATGESVSAHPFPGTTLVISEIGPDPTDPDCWRGVEFWVRDDLPEYVPRGSQDWILVQEYANNFWGGPAECEPDPDCSVPGRVNSGGDAPDRDPGDGVCDTGARTPSDEPECTLRAALEEANAAPDRDRITFDIPGAGPHVIAPGLPLPSIRQGIVIDGTSEAVAGRHGIVVDGSAVVASSGGDRAGLLVEGGLVEVRAIVVRGFGGDGVRSESASPLVLDSVEIADNAGWGVFSDSPVTLADGGGLGAVVRGNGSSPDREAGGVFSRAGGPLTAATLSGVTIVDNDGPGVLTLGRVRLGGASTISGNLGEGISVVLGGPTLWGAAVTVESGGATISGNRGQGLAVAEGDVIVPWGTSVAVTANAGWGIYVGNGVIRVGSDHSPLSPSPTTVSGNGAGGPCRMWGVDAALEPGFSDETCEGGGVFADTNNERTAVWLFGVEILDNGGPGVLVAEGIFRLGQARIERNRGPGIGAVAGTTGNAVKVWADWWDVAIRENWGPGILCDLGGVRVGWGAHLDLADNGSWGIFVPFGTVTMEADPELPSATSRVTGNGFGSECFWWDVGVDGRPGGDAFACEGGGIYAGPSGSGDTHALRGAEIGGNNGAGILATPRLRLEQCTVVDNAGPGVVVPEDPDEPPADLEVWGPAEIARNAGAGIEVVTGEVHLEGTSVSANAGTGVFVGAGNVEASGVAPDHPRIVGNGVGPTCHAVRLDRGVFPPWPERELAPCGGGGIVLGGGSVAAGQLDVEDNVGDGIRAEGDVRVEAGRICNNTGEQVVASGVVDLGTATTVCP